MFGEASLTGGSVIETGRQRGRARRLLPEQEGYDSNYQLLAFGSCMAALAVRRSCRAVFLPHPALSAPAVLNWPGL